MRIHDGRVYTVLIVLFIEFRFVDQGLVEHDAHVVKANAQVFSNLVLGKAGMVHGAAEVVVTGHFEFARLATVHTQTVTRTDVHIGRLRNHRLRSHIEGQLVGAHKHATEGAVGPEGTAAFLHRLEHLFLIVGTYSLFVFEGFVHPTEAGHGLAFPHGERRSVCPDNTACGDIGTEHACTDVDTEVHFFVDSRGVVVGGVVEQHAFVGSRHVRRLRTEVVAEQAREVEREREVRPEGHVGVRHGDDVRLEHSVDRGTGLITGEVFRRVGIVEVLEAEGHETGHREGRVILAHQGGFQVFGNLVHVAIGGVQLLFCSHRRRGIDHGSRRIDRGGRGEFLLRGSFFSRGFGSSFSGFFGHRFGSGFFHRSAFLGYRFGRSGLFGSDLLRRSGFFGSSLFFGRRFGSGFFHRFSFRCGGI